MFQRLRRTAASFVMVLICFLGYRLLAVPLIEPRVEPAARTVNTDPEGPDGTPPKPRQMDPYRRFFPPDAWEVNDPIVLENDRALLLMKDYRTLDNGQVELMPCTVLFLPDGPLSGDPEDALRRVIILEAPQGALVQFDQPVDLTRAKIGHLVGGEFHGPIKIHGNAGKPDAPEDLLILTSDVQMNTQLIWTLAPVEFHFGPNSGTGREMQIHLIASDHGGKQGPSVGGLESLDLLHDVQMRLVPGSAGMMPLDGRPGAAGQRPEARGQRAEGGGQRPGLPPPVPDMAPLGPTARTPGQLASKPAPPPQPPVDIRCQGKFHFDLLQYVATFEDQVDVLRVMQDGPSDQMNCERLSVYFAPRVAPTTAASGGSAAAANDGVARMASPPASPSGKPPIPGRQMPNKLEPRRIDARGHPVIVRAPSNGVYARGEHLDYNILSGRLLLEGGDEVTLQQVHNEIHARSVDYQPGEAGRLGLLMAVGPGWLRGAPPQNSNRPAGAANPIAVNPIVAPIGPQAPLQLFEAHWSDKLQMGLDEKNHLISLIGNARAGYTGQGELSADQIFLWLNDVPAPEPPRGNPRPNPTTSTPAATGPARTQVQPDRMLAQGNVRINSPQLSGNTGRLESWFAAAPPGPAIQPGAAGAPTGIGPSRSQPARGAPGSPQSPPSHYQIDGERIRVQFLLRGPTTEVADLAVDGQVRLTETMLPTVGLRPEDAPLEIRGEHLQVVRANQPDTGVTVSGQPAQAGSRGLEMYGAKIQLDKGLNQLWIDGPGRMKLPASRMMAAGNGPGSVGPRTSLMPTSESPSLSGRGQGRVGPNDMIPSSPQSPAAPLIVTWQEGMMFDGLKAQFKRSVVAQTDAPTEIRTMRTELLDVSLRRRIDFAQPKMSDHADVGQILCHDEVKMESRTQDARGLTSIQQMEARDLTIDEATGLIDGKGPGWLTSVRLGSVNLASSLPGAPGSPAAPRGATPAAADKNQLTYIRVDFQGPITGNINQHLVTFHDRVKTIYGPVPAWNARLDERSVDALGPNGGTMTCDALTVQQTDLISPVVAGHSAHHPLEMLAEGNVVAEGQLYTSRSARLTYTEAKDLIVLEGDGRGAAQLFRQERPGAPTSTTIARRIQYLRTANRVEVNDVRSITADQPGDPNPPANSAKPSGKKSLLNDDPRPPKQK